ncbi:MAG: class I SAM-dependent methyltransferase [Planctomycetes bacterium]|nr:class I SAM-dependent methyltransferase [Planctomycetota bacterium]
MPGMTAASYRLLDCGGGRRLERFGAVVVDRPAPAAAFPATLPPPEWTAADLAYLPGNGWQGTAPEEWRTEFGPAVMLPSPGAAGQLGVFPEHAAVAEFLATVLARRPAPAGGFRICNLFAHTGLVTLWLASLPSVGEVVHIDAASAAVRRARDNAVASGLADAPVRWLTEDARRFLHREIRRGHRYHCLVADPPAFGRSKTGGEWKLERDLPDLLAAMAVLTAPGGTVCLSCHRQGWGERQVRDAAAAGLPGRRWHSFSLAIPTASGGPPLAAGYAAVTD